MTENTRQLLIQYETNLFSRKLLESPQYDTIIEQIKKKVLAYLDETGKGFAAKLAVKAAMHGAHNHTLVAGALEKQMATFYETVPERKERIVKSLAVSSKEANSILAGAEHTIRQRTELIEKMGAGSGSFEQRYASTLRAAYPTPAAFLDVCKQYIATEKIIIQRMAQAKGNDESGLYSKLLPEMEQLLHIARQGIVEKVWPN